MDGFCWFELENCGRLEGPAGPIFGYFSLFRNGKNDNEESFEVLGVSMAPIDLLILIIQ